MACNCSLDHKMKATKKMDIHMERLNSFNALHAFKYESLSVYARCTVCYCFSHFATEQRICWDKQQQIQYAMEIFILFLNVAPVRWDV